MLVIIPPHPKPALKTILLQENKNRIEPNFSLKIEILIGFILLLLQFFKILFHTCSKTTLISVTEISLYFPDVPSLVNASKNVNTQFFFAIIEYQR